MRSFVPFALAGALALTLPGCAAKQLRSDLETAQSERDQARADLDAANKKLSAEQTARQLAEARMKAYEDLAKKLRAAFGDEGLNILIRDGRMIVQLPNAIVYESGKRELSAQGKKTLTTLAGVLKGVSDRRFLVAGHTDNVPVKDKAPGFKNNWELSVLRATTAVEFLVAGGVPKRHLGAAGYGDAMPMAKNTSAENKAQNRRLEIIVMPNADEIPPMPDKI